MRLSMPRPGCGTARPRHRVEVGLIEAACIRGHTLWSVVNSYSLRFEGCTSPLCLNRWSCRIFWVRRAIACVERRDSPVFHFTDQALSSRLL